MGKFKKIMVPPQWKEYWTAYPHGYTILEALVDWISEFNDIVENVNDWNEYLDDFVKTFEFELQEEVKKTIEKWQNEGLLDEIIASALNTELDNVKEQLAETRNEMQKFKGHTNSDEAVTTLLNIGLSYVDRPLIWYGQEGTLVSKNNTGRFWNGTHYRMDCSSFVEGVLRGITYENSAYLNNGVNYPIQNGFYFDEDFPRLYDRMLANEQAKYCTEKGWAYEPNEDYSNVHIGDLIFIPGTNENFFRKVEHVGFVFDVGQNDNITVLEMGNAQGKSDGKSGASINNYGKGWLRERGAFFGRIPLKESNISINTIPVRKIDDNVFRTYGKLYTRKVYTVIFDSPISAGYFKFGSSAEDTYYNFYNHMKRLPNQKYKATFVIPSYIEDVSPIIRFYGLGSPVDAIVTDLQLFDGVVTNYENKTKKEGVVKNENGTAVLFDNGFMECYTNITIPGTTIERGNLYISPDVTWQFPVPFIETPTVTGTVAFKGRTLTLSATPLYSSATFHTVSGSLDSTPANVVVRACGRWK